MFLDFLANVLHWRNTVRTMKSLAAISHLLSRRMYLVHTIISGSILHAKRPNNSNRTVISDLEDSHVIPGLIHKCYLAKSRYYFCLPS